MRFDVILFENFETLDVFGPVEVIGKLDQHYEIDFFSEDGGTVRSSQNARIQSGPSGKDRGKRDRLDPRGLRHSKGGR